MLDVRSPGEYAKGHIPGAINLPLFTDEERARVGTTYKQIGREEAFELGLEIVGPKMADLYRRGKGARSVYCWRGGMRSEWMARLLGTPRLEGGYKAYRRSVLHVLNRPYTFRVLGGYSGSGKTAHLPTLGQHIDLEALANHRGSAFGSQGEQPTQEMFENLLAAELEQMEGPIWVEDESRMIGQCKIPDCIYEQMQQAPCHLLEVPLEERISRLLEDYEELDEERLHEGIRRLQKRLGSERTTQALAADRRTAAKLLLDYYDRTYTYCLERRPGDVVNLG